MCAGHVTRGVLATLDNESLRLAFLLPWTYQEAMSRAAGDALGAPFRRMGGAPEPQLALTDGAAPHLAQDWTLPHASVPEGLVGTAAL